MTSKAATAAQAEIRTTSKGVKASAESVKDSAKQVCDSAINIEDSAASIEDTTDRSTQLAADRTMLAAERTYAAWVRTGLAALASGMGARALLSRVIFDPLVMFTSTVLVLFSAFCFCAAVWRELVPRWNDQPHSPATSVFHQWLSGTRSAGSFGRHLDRPLPSGLLSALAHDQDAPGNGPKTGRRPKCLPQSTVAPFFRFLMKRFLCVISLTGILSTPAHAQGSVERGRYLAILGDCAGCHVAAHQPLFSGGLPFNSPFGTVYSTNITPDKETGIGKWSSEDFYRALHEGIAPGGRYLYPAFPYIYFTRLSRRETDDLYAYLRTLRPVHRPATPNKLTFPFNLRFGLFFWDWLYLDRSALIIPAGTSAQWKRGEYLVNGLGHCAACHTPKTLLFGDERNKALEGGAVDYWFAPDITDGATDGLGQWTRADVVTFLATGRNRLTTVAGSMKEKIATSTSKMRIADLAAIAIYLKSVSSKQPPAWETPRREEMAQGQGIYRAQCQRCHAGNGLSGPSNKGTTGYPPLAANTMVMSRDVTTVLRIILTGGAAPQAAGQPPTHPMPAFGNLDDGQIAAVASYIRNAWGNRASPVSATDAHNLRRALANEPQ